jgi:hypothetical protein
MWEHICPKCRKTVKKNSRECPHCGEHFPLAIRVPPKLYKDPKTLEEYVHKHVFPKVSSAHRDYLAQFFTELFNDGFESGNFSAWTGTTTNGGGSIAVSSGQVHHGSYASRSQGASTNDAAYARKTITASAITYTRFYVYFADFNLAANKAVYLSSMDNGSTQYSLEAAIVESGGSVYWALSIRENYAQTWQLSDVSPVEGQWYCVEYLRDVTNDLEKLWVDGVSVKNVATAISTSTTRATAGLRSQNGDGANDIYVDCVVVADAYIGPEAAAILKEVTESLSLAEAVLRSKMLTMYDALGLAESLHGDKAFLLIDSASLSEVLNVIIGEVVKYITDSVNAADLSNVLKNLEMKDTLTLLDSAATPSRVLRALDAAGATEDSFVNKTLQITEAISITEVVEVGVGGAKKTRLFLIIGDVAVQLTGD